MMIKPFWIGNSKLSNKWENAYINFIEVISIKKIFVTNFFYTDHFNKIDICILPFIRQFRIANPEWFDHHIELPKVQKWLDNFLKSSILEEIMVSHEVWKKNNPAIFFPTNL